MTKMKPGSMIWMFFVHLVRSEISMPNAMPTREPPNATTKKETVEREETYKNLFFSAIVYSPLKHTSLTGQ